MTPDTFFTASPHWTWYIIPYFFVGGIAGGAYFLAALLQWFGRPEDRPVIRTGYSLAFWGAIISGALLTLDLGKPFRFWHMLFQSENFPSLMFKSWSPISFGAWAILLFGACAAVSWYASRAPDGPPKGGVLLARLVAALGGLLGFFVAGYTGVLLSVSNRPIWADSPWLGALFLVSGASTGAAALVLFAPGRGASAGSLRWLSSFDARALVVELLLLIVFVASLGAVAKVWLGFWGFVLLVGVVWAGILWPLRLHLKPAAAGGGFRNPALMVLLGGFLLRVVVLLASNSIAVHRLASDGGGMP
ncbi:MAG: NrfD/PsrC family molybdoenzyme membrane anchor subunit [Gemmatimonadales bacterium]